MLTRTFSALLVGASLAVGCTGTTSPSQGPATAAALASSKSTVVARTSPYAENVADLVTLVPADAHFVLEWPGRAGLGPIERLVANLSYPPLLKALAKEEGIDDEDWVDDFADAVQDAIAFGDESANGVLLHLDDATVADRMFKLSGVQASSRVASDERVLGRLKKHPDVQLVWYARSKVLLVASNAERALGVDKLMTGASKASFAASAARVPPAKDAIRVAANLAALTKNELPGALDPSSRGAVEMRFDGSVRTTTTLSLSGPRVPRLGALLAPHAVTLAARFPAETVAFSSMSTARAKGRGLRDLVRELERVGDGALTADAADTVAKQMLGLGLEDLDAILGDELAAGLIVDPSTRIDSIKSFDKLRFAAVVAVEVRDEARAKALLAALTDLARKQHKPGFQKTARGFRQRDVKDPTTLAVELHRGTLMIGAGVPAWLERIGKSLDNNERTLGETPEFKLSSDRFAEPKAAHVWINYGAIAQLGGVPFGFGKPRLGVLSLAPTNDSLELRYDSSGIFEVGLPIAAALFSVVGLAKRAEPVEMP